MAEQMRYTPRPWRFVEKGRGWRDARRIVACVDACEGIPTKALEAGVVREMVEALEALLPSIENAVGEIYYWPEYERAKAVLAKVRGEA